MWIQVRTMDGARSATIDDLSRCTKICDLRKRIEKEFSVDPEHQKLFYRGKQLQNDHTLYDYGVHLNDIVQMIVMKPAIKTHPNDNEDKRQSLDEDSDKENEKTEERRTERTDCLIQSKHYKVNDKIDIINKETKSWSEGRLLRITKAKNDESDVLQASSSTGNDNISDDLLNFHVAYENESNESHQVKMESIRLRARQRLDVTELSEGMKVMVNYNLDDPSQLGHYFDMTITQIVLKRKPIVAGTLHVGNVDDQLYLKDAQLTQFDKIWRIEPLIEVKNRESDYDNGIPNELRPIKPDCEKCKDNSAIKCTQCSCTVCGGKDSPDKQIVCDECEDCYHLWCLSPALSDLPDDDWFCPACKNDETEIVRAGEGLKANRKKAKMPSATNNTKRDWGRGMATMGTGQTCTLVPTNHFGPIPGVEMGSLWRYRNACAAAGVHRMLVAGIHGKESEGAYSLCISGGYEDDVDNGDEFKYTGSGGRDLSGNKRTAAQSKDQTMDRNNKALAMNCFAPFNATKGAESADWQKGKPVRVIRSNKGGKSHSQYAPEIGIRYDGIYKVVKYWPETGKSGFKVWRYLLRRDDPLPAPWTEEGKRHNRELGTQLVVPEGYYEKEEAKKLKKAGAKKEKAVSSTAKRPNESPPLAPIFKQAKAMPYTPEESLVNRIKEDDSNKKLWDECLGFCPEGKKKFIKKVEELFTCVCCQDLVYNPVTIECKHSVCKACLKRSFKSEVYSCPHCRFNLGKGYVMETNDTLQKILLELFPGYDSGR